MRALPLAILSASLLAACATTRMADSEKLALYAGNAGAPVRSIPYTSPIAWERIDDRHLLLTTRPNQAWLFRLPPNCLNWVGSGPAIGISSQAGFVSAGFDRVTSNAPGAPISCRIEEIRPVDVAGVRAATRARAAAR